MPEKKMGACIMFVNSAEQVLLFLRDDKDGLPFRNCWDIPGGGVEANELPENTIRREMREEIEMDLHGHQLFRTYDLPDRIEHAFWKASDLDITRTPQHEGQAMKWFSESEVNAMPVEIIAYDFKPVLLDFFREEPWRL